MKQSQFILAAQPSAHVTFLKWLAYLLENVWGSTDCNELNELSAFFSMRLGCLGLGIRSALCTGACLCQLTDPNICSFMATSVSLASTCMALCWVPIHKPHTNISTCLEPNARQYMKSFHHSFLSNRKKFSINLFLEVKNSIFACVCMCVRLPKTEMRKTEARVYAISSSEPPGAGPPLWGLPFLFSGQALLVWWDQIEDREQRACPTRPPAAPLFSPWAWSTSSCPTSQGCPLWRCTYRVLK